ncbi:hypothetical protein Tco_0804574 [Tanacetum coccineum]|uniref:Uncharacterized protein n=1 Tax=Tanacetum coccineum TaxID=301880 RepID=A0ABQ5A7J9_9ASTR
MHTTMGPEQVKTMEIQAGKQGSRPEELKRHLQLWKCFRRLYYVVIVLDRNIVGEEPMVTPLVWREHVHVLLPSFAVVIRGTFIELIETLSTVKVNCKGFLFSLLPRWATSNRGKFPPRLPPSSTLHSEVLLQSNSLYTLLPSLFGASSNFITFPLCLRARGNPVWRTGVASLETDIHKRTKNKAKNDKTEHGMEKCEAKSKPKVNQVKKVNRKVKQSKSKSTPTKSSQLREAESEKNITCGTEIAKSQSYITKIKGQGLKVQFK